MNNLHSEIVKNPKIPTGAALLYLFLLDKQRNAGVATASIKELSEALMVSRPTIIRYKKALVNAGVIQETRQKREDGGFGASKFKVMIDKEQ